MNSILTAIYNDTFSIYNLGKSNDRETEELLQRLCRHEDTLNRALSEELRDIFEKYEDCSTELQRKEEEQYFIRGFRLGVRLMLEALSNE